MAATTAALLAATSAVGLYGAQAERAKELVNALQGASPVVQAEVASLKTENTRLTQENARLAKEKATLDQEKSVTLAKLVKEEQTRQALTQKIAVNSPAEQAFRKATPQVLGKAAERIITATSPSERVAGVLKGPSSSLFRRGTLQQLYQLVLQAEGMSEPEAAAAAVPAPPAQPESADGGIPEPEPVQPESADGGIPEPVPVQPESADGGIPEPANMEPAPIQPAPDNTGDGASDPGSRRSSDPAEAAMLSPETKALINAADTADMALDEVLANARRNALPGAKIDMDESVIAAREAARTTKAAADAALGKMPLGPPTSGLGVPQSGGAKVATTYEDFGKIWLDAIVAVGGEVILQKESKVASDAQAKLDKQAAAAAALFNSSLGKVVQKVERDLASLPPPDPQSAITLALGKALYLLGKTRTLTTEAQWNEVKADHEWDADIKQKVLTAFDEYKRGAAAPSVPLSQRLFGVRTPAPPAAPGAAPRPSPFRFPAFNLGRVAPAPVVAAPPVSDSVPNREAAVLRAHQIERASRGWRPEMLLPAVAPAPAVVAPAPAVVAPAPVVAPEPVVVAPEPVVVAPAPVVAPAVVAPISLVPGVPPVLAGKSVEELKKMLDEVYRKSMAADERMEEYRSKGTPVPRALAYLNENLDNRIAALKKTIALVSRTGRAAAAAPAPAPATDRGKFNLFGSQPLPALPAAPVLGQEFKMTTNPLAVQERKKLKVGEQKAQLEKEGPGKLKRGPTRKTKFGGSRKRALKTRRGINKRKNVGGSRRR